MKAPPSLMLSSFIQLEGCALPLFALGHISTSCDRSVTPARQVLGNVGVENSTWRSVVVDGQIASDKITRARVGRSRAELERGCITVHQDIAHQLSAADLVHGYSRGNVLDCQVSFYHGALA